MDILTLFLIIALTNILLALAMVSMADRPGHDAMGLWSLATLINACAFLGFIWNAHFSHPLLSLVSNSLTVLWLILIGEGLQRFYQRKQRLPRWLLWLLLPVTVITLLPVLDNFQGRVLLMAIILSCQTMVLLFIVFSNRDNPPGRGQLLIGTSLGALLILLGVRALSVVLGALQSTMDLLQPHAVQIITFQGGLLATILLAMGMIVIAQERTGQILEAAQTQLRLNEEKFRGFVEHANDIIYTLNLDGSFQYMSPNIREILAQEPEDFVGAHFANIVHPEDLPICQQFLEHLLTTRSKQSGLEYRVRHKTAGWRWHITNASPLFAKDGTIVGMLGIAHDITERKHKETQIMHMAHHDALTGLPNRTLLFSRLDQALTNARTTGKRLALMFLDLDKFKPINDTHGHAVGDFLLQQAAQRLLNSVRESDMVARIGGDEFIVMLPEIRQPEHAIAVADTICQALQTPFCINELELSVSTSIGVAIYPEHGQDSHILAQHADSAMYHAKQSGANQIQCYTPELAPRELSHSA